jgi:integrase
MQIVEQAALPKEPWRPLYWRDAGIVVVGSLLLALFAMWLVELFNRPAPQPSVVVAQPVFAGALLPGRAPPLALNAIESPRLPRKGDPPLLARPYALPRELDVEDTAALLRAADPDTRRAILLLLAGVSPEELLQLQWEDVDRATAVVRVGGPGARQVKLGMEAAAYFRDGAAAHASPLVPGPGAEPASLASLSANILCAAHDAGLEDVDTVTPAALRHTYLAYLVRQGIRFSDLTQLVGSLPREELAAYSALAPTGPRLTRESVKTVFPATQRQASARALPGIPSVRTDTDA